MKHPYEFLVKICHPERELSFYINHNHSVITHDEVFCLIDSFCAENGAIYEQSSREKKNGDIEHILSFSTDIPRAITEPLRTLLRINRVNVHALTVKQKTR